MRKSLLLLAFLFLVSLTVLAVGHGTVSAMQDDVTVTETTVAGDPAAAAGLTVALHTQYDNHLFWRTTYAAGTDPAPETEFTFSASGLQDINPGQDYVYLEVGSTNFGVSGDSLDMYDLYGSVWSERLGAPIMVRPAADVATRTQAGETHTETVYLRDYYKYYTVGLGLSTDVTFGFGVNAGMDRQDNQQLSEYFRIPVPEGAQVEVSVSKDATGGVYDVDCSGLSDSGVSSTGVVTKEGLYLGLGAWTDETTGAPMVDFSEIAGGYGVYFIPIERTEGLHVATDQIQNIYPMDQETETLVNILELPEETQLLLFTLEQGQLVLTVMDQETLETVQRLELPTAQIPTVWQQDDLLVLQVYDTSSRLLVLPRENGTYRLWLDTPEFRFDDRWYSDPQFFFDGDRLAMAYNYHYSSSVRMAVYDETGLAYAGEYGHNADTFYPNLYTGWSDALTLQ